MTNVCTHAGLSRSEKRLLIPAKVFDTKELLDGELSLDEDDEGLSGGDGRRLADDLDFRPPARPDSSI